jgi:flagellin-like protein
MLKSRKGISPILATLLLIVIAVAAIVVTYAWVITFTGNVTGQDVQLREINTSWNSTANTIKVDLSNQGTADGKIDSVYIGTSATNLNLKDDASVTYDPATKIIASHGTISIVLIHTWEFNKEYYFKIHPEVGVDYEFHKTSPAS